MKALLTPNLPTQKVKICAVSSQYNNIIRALEKLHIHSLPIPSATLLPTAISHHPDMLLYHLGGRKILVGINHPEIIQQLTQWGFTLSLSTPLGSNYPYDCLLNCARVGNILFANTQSCERTILEYAKQQKLQVMHIAQGYTKCSTAVVSSRAIITADSGIHKAAQRAGLYSLLIRPGYISLPGYNYGFIGGCCGLLAPDILAFTGQVKYHPDFYDIRSFCTKAGVKILPLLSGPLVDTGSILPLIEL